MCYDTIVFIRIARGKLVMDTMWLPVLVTGEGPKYLALTRALRDAVRSGELKQGAQLPTVRELAYQLSVTPGTVSRAYQMCIRDSACPLGLPPDCLL